MKSVGEYLKSIRLAKNLTIEQATLVTKISKGTLISIEEGKAENLPAKSYLRGFVFAYGKFLGANMNELNALFSQELGTTNPEIKIEEVKKQTWKTVPFLEKIQINSKTYIVCGLVALTAIAIVAQKTFQKYKSETVIPVSQETITNNNNEVITTTADELKKINMESISETKPTASDKETPTQIAQGPAIINQNTFLQKSKFSKEVLIEANEDTAVKIKIGNEDEKMIKLLKGDFHTIKAKSKVTVETINLKDIKVIFNGTLYSAKKEEIKLKMLSF